MHVPGIGRAHAAGAADGDRPVDRGGVIAIESTEHAGHRGGVERLTVRDRRQRCGQQDDAEVGVGVGGDAGGSDRLEDREPKRPVRGRLHGGRDRDGRSHEIGMREVGKRRPRMDVSRLRRRGLDDSGDRRAPAAAPRWAGDRPHRVAENRRSARTVWG